MKLRDIIERSRDFLDLSGDNTNKSQLVLSRVMKKKTETWKLQKMIFFFFFMKFMVIKKKKKNFIGSTFKQRKNIIIFIFNKI